MIWNNSKNLVHTIWHEFYYPTTGSLLDKTSESS